MVPRQRFERVLKCRRIIVAGGCVAGRSDNFFAAFHSAAFYSAAFYSAAFYSAAFYSAAFYSAALTPAWIKRDVDEMRNSLLVVYAVGCYVAFLVVFLCLLLFLVNWGLPRTIDHGATVSMPAAVAIDLALITLFGVVHSVMARDSFKRWWVRFVPQPAERSTYVLQSSFFLGLILWGWQPLPEPTVWEFDAWWSRSVMQMAFAGGVVLVLVSTLLIDHQELVGLRQAFCHARGTEMPEPSFKTPGLYKIVRHPLQFGFLLIVYATPAMTIGHGLFAVAMTVYIMVGLFFEERGLVRTFGEPYREYQRRVPKLIPGGNFLRMVVLC